MCRIPETPSPVQERQHGGGSHPHTENAAGSRSFIASLFILGRGWHRVKARGANSGTLTFRAHLWLPQSLIEKAKVKTSHAPPDGRDHDPSNLFAELAEPRIMSTYDVICPASL